MLPVANSTNEHSVGQVDIRVVQSSILPEHVAEIPGTGGEWTVWRCAGLRATGFPAERALRLADLKAAEAAEHLLQVETLAASAKTEALAFVNRRLDALRQQGEWRNHAKREPLLKARRAIDDDRAPKDTSDPETDRVLQTFRSCLEAVQHSRAEFEVAVSAAERRISQGIREIACDPLFQEAVIWQNRHVFHTAIKKFGERAADDTTMNFSWRQREELVANYVQRYCLKNDTIGYFGPVGWARFIDQPGYVEAKPGPSLLATRQVYLESWCVEALASTLAKNPALRRWLIPRLMPFVRIEGCTLHLPSRAPLAMAPHHIAVLKACDGATAAADLASSLLAAPDSGFRSEREILLLLERLRALNLISWELPIPVIPQANETFSSLIGHIRDENVRQASLACLQELQTAADQVGRSAGSAEKLDAALAELEATFTRLTQKSATRSAGQTYAGRTLVYEDCRRNIDVTLGADLLGDLAPPLTLLLVSARWYTYTIAARCAPVLRRIYEDLVRETGSTTIDGVRFWYRFQTSVLGDDNLLANALADFQQHWTNILGPHGGQHRLVYTSAALRDKVHSVFDVPHPGWELGRYQCPDVMIAAPSIEAIRQGDYQFVLGEVHLSVNTLNQWVFMAQHPYPEAMRGWIESDLPDPMVVGVAPKQWPTLTTRTQVGYISPKNHRVVFSHGANDIAPQQAISLAYLVVDMQDGRLLVHTRDRSLSFDAIEVFADALSFLLNEDFRFLPRLSHMPRITIDRLVTVRESWSIEADQLTFAAESTTAARFLGMRRWAANRELPRFLFVKVPLEKKPFYLDLYSPLYVDLFCKNVRRTQASDRAHKPVVFTEMLPQPHEAWLPDVEGRHYTSELRIVVVDRAPKWRNVAA